MKTALEIAHIVTREQVREYLLKTGPDVEVAANAALRKLRNENIAPFTHLGHWSQQKLEALATKDETVDTDAMNELPSARRAEIWAALNRVRESILGT